MKSKKALWIIAAILVVLAIAGFFLNQRYGGKSGSVEKFNKDYYISFDNYYFEVPEQKAVDDQIIANAQFVYNTGTAIKTNSLDDIFNSGAVGIQSLIPLNSNNQAFESYLNNTAKPAAASSFQGEAELTLSDRKDGVKVANLLSKKNGQVLRRQYILNLPQSVSIVSKDDSDTFKAIGSTVGRASDKFSSYEDLKVLVVSSGAMVKYRMFDALFAQAHDDLKAATSVDAINQIADRSKEVFNLETKVFGVKIINNELTATIHFVDAEKPANNKTVLLSFRQSGGKWKLITLKLPEGIVTGVAPEAKP